jgi:DNA-binding phage protein
MFSDKVTMIIAIIIGIAIGFGLGFLSKAIIDKVRMAELEKERDQALLQKETFRQNWEKALNELNQTKVLLNDTLAALELLRQYQQIDDETRKKIAEIDKTLDPEGNPTEDTYERFRRLIKEVNERNEEYNTAIVASIEEIDFEPFIELREEAEKLFDEATNLLLQYKE